MANTPLRADSACCNVVRLPTAAARKIRNSLTAARAYRKKQPEWPMASARWTRFAERAALAPHSDVPTFDPNNPVHVAAWEAICAFSRLRQQEDGI